jgi:hypothetical protein
MALGACHTQDENFIGKHHLVDHLENKFQAEIKNMGKSQIFRDPILFCFLLS